MIPKEPLYPKILFWSDGIERDWTDPALITIETIRGPCWLLNVEAYNATTAACTFDFRIHPLNSQDYFTLIQQVKVRGANRNVIWAGLQFVPKGWTVSILVNNGALNDHIGVHIAWMPFDSVLFPATGNLIGASPDFLFEHQADAYLSQTNPVSTTLYTVLATTQNVRIISIEADLIWATTQPTPLEVVITIDGQTIIHIQANPANAAAYMAIPLENALANAQGFSTTQNQTRAFLYEGRSVKIQARITWATTQPTPLVCRVKYAKIP